MAHLRRWSIVAVVLVGGALYSEGARGTDIFIDPSGSNDLSTITNAISAASAGDTIFMRGGTYNLSGSLNITKTGTAANPFHLFAYPGETPILDFSGVGSGQKGISLNTNYWHIKGLTIQKAKDNGLYISGSNNIAELLTVRQNQDSGVQISANGSLHPSNNHVLNVDSYFNYDPGNHGENADGFAVKFRNLGPDNVLEGVRAWNNSDDGFDFWMAESGVTVLNSWAFHNGYNLYGDLNFQGDGNGVKLGHDSGTHVVGHMLIWGNVDKGVDVNGNATDLEAPSDPIPHGVQIYNVTSAYNPGKNFNFDEDPTTASPPTTHILRNNISFFGGQTIDTGNTADHNTFPGPAGEPAITLMPGDLVSFTDPFTNGSLANPMGTGPAVAPRQADGSLPFLDFLRIPPGSQLIDAGVDVGLPFNGSAPDLGVFEFLSLTGLAGDYNNDGIVDAADYTIWRDNEGTSNSLFNDEIGGVIDEDQYTQWRDNFGMTAGSGAGAGSAGSAPVPEPSSGVLLLLVALVLAFCRSRR